MVKNGQTHGTPYCGHGYVPLRFGGEGNIIMRMGTQQQHMIKGIISAFDHMEICFVINLAMCGNRAVAWQPIIASGYVSLLLP